jgi:hypothetical protein
MIEEKTFSTVITALSDAGYHHILRFLPDYGYMLVCVSFKDDGRLSGPCFNLYRASDHRHWIISEMGRSDLFLVPSNAPIGQVCVDCLRDMNQCMRIPDTVVRRYGLLPSLNASFRELDQALLQEPDPGGR